MKKILWIMFLATSVFAQEEKSTGIAFEHGSWSEALSKAKKEKKLIMLDAFASWCGPCKWMTKNIFPLREVGEFYNTNFINVKMDMEKGEGIKLAEKYGVIAYPTFFYVDGSGKIIHQTCGGQEADQFIQSGKDALNPEVRTSTISDKYASSPKDSKVALAYFKAATGACIDIEAKVKNYTEKLEPNDFLAETNFEIVENFISDFSHISIISILKEYNKFSDKFGKDRIELKMKNVFTSAIQASCRSMDEASLNKVRSAYRSQKSLPINYLDDFSEMSWSEAKSDSVSYYKAAIKFCDTYLLKDWQQLNSMAWTFYERTTNEAHLQKATEWAEKSISLQKEYANMDTYAALLYKRGKLNEAKLAAEQAIEIGKANKDEVKDTESLLEKINAQIKN